MKQVALKKIITILLVLMGIPSFAQEGFEIGIAYMLQKTMLFNKSDRYLADRMDREGTWSYLNGGLTLGYHFNRTWAVEADIFRTRQGQEYSGFNPAAGLNQAFTRNISIISIFNRELPLSRYDLKAELNGLKVPLLLKWSTCTQRPLSFHVGVGPQFNIITNVVYELNGEDVSMKPSGMKNTDAYKRVTIDGVLSPGIAYKLSDHVYLNADVRLEYGFGDVENKDAYFTYMRRTDYFYGQGRKSTHNMVLGAVAGVSYRL